MEGNTTNTGDNALQNTGDNALQNTSSNLQTQQTHAGDAAAGDNAPQSRFMGGNTLEPTAQDSIIAQLQAQNAALMQQNTLLNQQVINLVQNGGQLTNAPQQLAQPKPAQPAATHPTQAEQLAAMGMQFEAQPSYMQPPASLSNAPDMALESLANDIGKDRPKH